MPPQFITSRPTSHAIASLPVANHSTRAPQIYSAARSLGGRSFSSDIKSDERCAYLSAAFSPSLRSSASREFQSPCHYPPCRHINREISKPTGSPPARAESFLRLLQKEPGPPKSHVGLSGRRLVEPGRSVSRAWGRGHEVAGKGSGFELSCRFFLTLSAIPQMRSSTARTRLTIKIILTCFFCGRRLPAPKAINCTASLGEAENAKIPVDHPCCAIGRCRGAQ